MSYEQASRLDLWLDTSCLSHSDALAVAKISPILINLSKIRDIN